MEYFILYQIICVLRQTDRQTERERERQTDRKRERERECTIVFPNKEIRIITPGLAFKIRIAQGTETFSLYRQC